MTDVDQSVSAIDDKSSENNGDSSSDENQSDWVGFAKSLVYNFLHIMVFIIIGSNFIFFTYYDSLDLIFPFSSKVYFPGNMQNGGGKKSQRGGGSGFSFPKYDTKKSKTPSSDLLKSLGYDGKMSGWPYTMYNNRVERLSWDGFKNWFALTEGESFMMYRYFMQNIFKGGDKNLFQKVPKPILYVLAYLLFAMGFFVVFMGFITTIWKSFTCVPNAWVYSLTGCLLYYTWVMAMCNGLLQYLSFMWNLLVVPLLIDHNVVKEICASNISWLSMLFGALTVGSALRHLDKTTSSVMLAAWVIMVIKQLFF